MERIEFRHPSFVTSAPSTDKALAASLYTKSVLDTIINEIGISPVERFQSTGAGVGNVSMIGGRGMSVVPEIVPSLVADRHRAPYSISMCCSNPAGMSTPTNSLGHSTYTIRSIVVGGSLSCLVFASHDTHKYLQVEDRMSPWIRIEFGTSVYGFGVL